MGWGENDRGVSFTFGAEVVAKFLHKHDFDLICRAHQVSLRTYCARIKIYCLFSRWSKMVTSSSLRGSWLHFSLHLTTVGSLITQVIIVNIELSFNCFKLGHMLNQKFSFQAQ